MSTTTGTGHGGNNSDPSTWKAKKVDLCESEDTLIYIMSFRPTRVKYRDPDSKKGEWWS